MLSNVLKKITILLFLPMLFACQTTQEPPRVVSDVTIFHTFYPDDDETLFVKAAHQNLDESIEFSSYKNKIENKLLENGLKVASEEAAADYIAIINYGIDDGTTTTQVGSVPIIGQTSGGYTTHSGSIYSGGGYGSYSGSSYTYPTYGVVGSSSYSYNVTTFNRLLTMDIFKKAGEQQVEKVYEAKVKSNGRCGQINQVIDGLLGALFSEFPGENGSTKKYKIQQNKQPNC